MFCASNANAPVYSSKPAVLSYRIYANWTDETYESTRHFSLGQALSEVLLEDVSLGVAGVEVEQTEYSVLQLPNSCVRVVGAGTRRLGRPRRLPLRRAGYKTRKSDKN